MRFVKAAVVAAVISAATLAATVPPVSKASTVSSASPASMLGVVASGRVTPNPSAPGTATTFDVFCGREAVSATLFGVTLGLADLILMHSTARTLPGEFVVTVTLPANIAPGRYHPDFDCSNGNAGKVSFTVDQVPKQAPDPVPKQAADPVPKQAPDNPVPKQAPGTGDGTTATQTGTPLASIGYSLMGLGVLTGAGAIALRRRVAQRS